MNASTPTLAIRFDIDALEKKHPDVCYGEAAWGIVVAAVDFPTTRGQCSLFEGDSLNNEYVFCIALQSSSRSVLDKIQAAVGKSSDFKDVAHSCPILTDTDRGRIVSLPLVHNAEVVDGQVNIITNTMLRGALAKQRQRARETATGTITTAIPERRRPASSRTASLPAFSSRDNLVAFLEKTFGVPNVYGAYVTPEELCDIVEKYQDVTKSFLMYDSYHGDEMRVQLLAKTDADELFGANPKPRSTSKGILFGGLTEFASHADAINYCNKSVSTRGGVDSAWNIQGKHALNFMIQTGFTEQIDPSHPLNADELWKEICTRRERLGIPTAGAPAKNPEPARSRQSAAQTSDRYATARSPTSGKKWWQFWK
jgi:hypothetical protein